MDIVVKKKKFIHYENVFVIDGKEFIIDDLLDCLMELKDMVSIY